MLDSCWGRYIHKLSCVLRSPILLVGVMRGVSKGKLVLTISWNFIKSLESYWKIRNANGLKSPRTCTKFITHIKQLTKSRMKHQLCYVLVFRFEQHVIYGSNNYTKQNNLKEFFKLMSFEYQHFHWLVFLKKATRVSFKWQLKRL